MTGNRLIPYLAAGCALLATPALSSAALAQSAQTTQQAPGAAVAWTTEARATVESVDQTSREVVLRGPGGSLFTVTAGPAVQNFSQIKPGDQVVVRYVEALAARLAKPDESGGAVAAQGGIARTSPPGASPSGVMGDQIRATIQVEQIDRANNRLTFTGPSGAVRTVAVHDPDAQRFLHTLKPGDRVDLLYTESLAVAVEPMQR